MMNFLVIEFINLIVCSMYVFVLTDGIKEFSNPERTENVFILVLYGFLVLAFVLRIIFNYIFNHSRERIFKFSRKYYFIIIPAFISLVLLIILIVSEGNRADEILNASVRVLIFAIIIAAILNFALWGKIKKQTAIKIKIRYVLIVTLIGVVTPFLILLLLLVLGI